jgi:hypothetical protein
MARKPKTQDETKAPGALVVDAGEVLEVMGDFNTRDGERASDAASDRQEIGQYLEKTGLNKKAFSHGRMVLRMKKPTDRADWLRSMRVLFPIIEAEIEKQTSLDLEAPADAVKAATAAE